MRFLQWGACLIVVFLVDTAAAANLRVMSFNVGMDRILALRSRSTVEAIFTSDPRVGRAHVFALQELCLNETESLARFIRLMLDNHRVQYHYADYAGQRNSECGKGQAVVSAYPIADAGTVKLPRVGARRVFVWVDLRVEGPTYQRLRLYNVHFSNRAGTNLTPLEGRLEQARAVLLHAAEFRRRFPTAPVVVAGDFNSLGNLYDPARREPAVREMTSYFRPVTDGFSPTMLLPYKVDWIFYSGLRLRRSKVEHVLLSDHFPLVADFDF